MKTCSFCKLKKRLFTPAGNAFVDFSAHTVIEVLALLGIILNI